MSHKKGFTLLEILLVVGIIAILSGIVIIAINPARQLANVRDAQRKLALSEINSALAQYTFYNPYPIRQEYLNTIMVKLSSNKNNLSIPLLKNNM